jgi:hypothetical protein
MMNDPFFRQLNTPSAWRNTIDLTTSGTPGSPSDMTTINREASYCSSAVWSGGGGALTTGKLTCVLTKVGRYKLATTLILDETVAATSVRKMQATYTGNVSIIQQGQNTDAWEEIAAASNGNASFYSERYFDVTVPGQYIEVNPRASSTWAAGTHSFQTIIELVPYLG